MVISLLILKFDGRPEAISPRLRCPRCPYIGEGEEHHTFGIDSTYSGKSSINDGGSWKRVDVEKQDQGQKLRCIMSHGGGGGV